MTSHKIVFQRGSEEDCLQLSSVRTSAPTITRPAVTTNARATIARYPHTTNLGVRSVLGFVEEHTHDEKIIIRVLSHVDEVDLCGVR